tara:strand:+ start:7074 stop:8024 length:951 start_codon:yes stop_codon:yes gene_type:complete
MEMSKWMLGGDFYEAATEAGGCRKAAAARVAIGAQLEQFAATACTRICPTARIDKLNSPTDQRQACQLYFDAYCAATWTSAHAEYLAALDCSVVEPPPPSIATVPCAASAIDMSDLYSRRVATKGDGYPKAVEPLVQLLSRCTNPGSRGWESVLKNALDHPGSRHIVMHAIHTCIVGLHPQLHPAMRPDWKTRMKILRLMPQTGGEMKIVSTYVKEALRRCLASTMAASPAMHTALSLVGHPVRHILQPPAQFPHVGMEAAMTAFVEAGTRLAHGETWPSCLYQAFGSRAHKAESGVVDDELSFAGMGWDAGWLGG